MVVLSQSSNPCDTVEQYRITPGEHLDYRSIQAFRQLCPKPCSHPVEVIVDLSATQYMDSSGVALLLCLYQWVRAPQVEVVVTGCCRELLPVLASRACRRRLRILPA